MCKASQLTGNAEGVGGGRGGGGGGQVGWATDVDVDVALYDLIGGDGYSYTWGKKPHPQAAMFFNQPTWIDGIC